MLNQHTSKINICLPEPKRDLCAMTGQLHRGQRSKLSQEERLARKICFENSYRERDPDEIPETVFTGTASMVCGEVLAILAGSRTDVIPDCPQGLVLTNVKGEGFFDNLY
jgi:hypothetical protein